MLLVVYDKTNVEDYFICEELRNTADVTMVDALTKIPPYLEFNEVLILDKRIPESIFEGHHIMRWTLQKGKTKFETIMEKFHKENTHMTWTTTTRLLKTMNVTKLQKIMTKQGHILGTKLTCDVFEDLQKTILPERTTYLLPYVPVHHFTSLSKGLAWLLSRRDFAIIEVGENLYDNMV